LERDADHYEFRAFCLMQAPFMLYLGGRWLVDKLDDFFPEEERAWRAAMDGYTHIPQVYQVLYEPLRDRGHIRSALDRLPKDSASRDNILQQIAVAYTAGWESLGDDKSLIRHILDSRDERDIGTIITFFWRNRRVDYLAESSRGTEPAVLGFWRWCHDKAVEDPKPNSGLLAELSQLAVYLDEITPDAEKWLKASAEHVTEGHREYELVNELDRLAEKSPKGVAAIFRVLLKGERPPYPDDDVRSLLRKLRDAGERDVVSEACEAYLRDGVDLHRLGDVCEG
jgi:hypothetical protein